MKYLPPCNTCLRRLSTRADMLQKEYKCKRLFLWDMNRDCDLSRCSLPNNYPNELIPKNGKLKPVQLSF